MISLWKVQKKKEDLEKVQWEDLGLMRL